MNIFSNTICDHNGDSDDDDVMNDVPQMNCELTVAAGGCVCVLCVSSSDCSVLRIAITSYAYFEFADFLLLAILIIILVGINEIT